jgi:hypothetical protein
MKKSELRQMIREVLREELAVHKKALKEAIGTTANEIINRYDNNVADHIAELEHEKAFADAAYFEEEWYTLTDVKINPDYYILIMDKPVDDADVELIISYAFDAAIDVADAMSDGGIVQDSESNEIYVERWVIEG